MQCVMASATALIIFHFVPNKGVLGLGDSVELGAEESNDECESGCAEDKMSGEMTVDIGECSREGTGDE